MAKFTITIDNPSLGGLCPKYYESDYPSYGNKNQAGEMENIDCTNAGFIQQGPTFFPFTNGDEGEAVTTLIKGATDYAVASNVAYGVGGNKLYKFSEDEVINAGAFPHTIDKGTVTGEDGEDVVLYLGSLYYSYNHSGGAGDVGKYDLASTFDDDFFSAGVAGGGAHALEGDVPHQMVATVNQLLYVTNGRYIAEYNGTTDVLTYNKLTFPSGWVTQSIKWVNNRLWIAVNKTSLTGSNKNQASLFVWDGTTTNPEAEIQLSGTVGGLYVKNSILYVFYQDVTNTGGYKLAYISGNSIIDLANLDSGLPQYYQITEYQDFIVFSSGSGVYAWGSGDKDLPVRFFQFAENFSSTSGCLVCPFGQLVSAGYSSGYVLGSLTGCSTNSSWKSLMFDITNTGKSSSVESVRINFEKLQDGPARVDVYLVNNRGETIHTEEISYSRLGAKTTHIIPLNGKIQENFRVEFYYNNGSNQETIRIKSIKIKGSID